MTAAAAQAEDNGGIYNAPDAKTAIKIYREEIAPRKAFIAEKTGDLSDPYKRIKDECHFPRVILDLLIRLSEMEDAKRDHFLTAMHAGLTELNLTRPFDLVARAEGADAEAPIIPTAARKRPKLVTVPTPPTDDSELLGAADDEPDAGTGAAAIAAMKAAAGGDE